MKQILKLNETNETPTLNYSVNELSCNELPLKPKDNTHTYCFINNDKILMHKMKQWKRLMITRVLIVLLSLLR